MTEDLLRQALKALEPWERHLRAIGTDQMSVRFYTETGYREVPRADLEGLALTAAAIRAALEVGK